MWIQSDFVLSVSSPPPFVGLGQASSSCKVSLTEQERAECTEAAGYFR